MTAPDARPELTPLEERLRSGGVSVRESSAELRARLGATGPLPVAMPADDEQARFVLAAASRAGMSVAPLGGGRGLQAAGRAQPPRLLLSTEKMAGVLDHSEADFVVSLRAGTTLRSLQESLAPSRQWLAIEPPDAETATFGGLIGAAAPSLLESTYGNLRAVLLGCRVLHGDGRITHAGGKVVKNVSGYDLMKLYHGAHGRLGLVLDATVRLRPWPACDRLLVAEGEDLLGRAGPTGLRDALPADPTALHYRGRLEQPGETLGLRLHGAPAAVEVLVAEARRCLSSAATGESGRAGGRASKRAQGLELHEVPAAPGGARPAFLNELQQTLSHDQGTEQLLLGVFARPSRAAAIGHLLRQWATEHGARGSFVLDGGTGRWWLRFDAEASPQRAAVDELQARLQGQGHAQLQDQLQARRQDPPAAQCTRMAALAVPADWLAEACTRPVGGPIEGGHAAIARRLEERLDPTGVLSGRGGEEAR